MTEWLTPPQRIDLHPHQAHVWRVSLSSISPDESALSEDERQRASRFHFDADRDRYVAAHASLRGVLSRYLQCEPRELKFSANEFGKPFLSNHEIEFNLSHSGEFALVGIAHKCKVGVDVELIREDLELEDLARRYFSLREVSELMALKDEQRVIGFFNCWTRKEAYIKAQGLGLSLPLDSFDVSLGEPALLHATRPDAKVASRWSLRSLDVESNYAAALAVEGNNLEVQCWDWNINQ